MGTGEVRKAKQREYNLRSRRKYGAIPKFDIELRFWLKVDKTESCWNWTGGLNDSGYGRYPKNGRAHRYSYELARGPIPEGLTLDHLCRNRRCVNPDHLEPVSNEVNVMRGEGFGPHNKAKTHCPQGHEYTPENTRLREDGRWRDCRTCHAERWTH